MGKLRIWASLTKPRCSIVTSVQNPIQNPHPLPVFPETRTTILYPSFAMQKANTDCTRLFPLFYSTSPHCVLIKSRLPYLRGPINDLMVFSRLQNITPKKDNVGRLLGMLIIWFKLLRWKSPRTLFSVRPIIYILYTVSATRICYSDASAMGKNWLFLIIHPLHHPQSGRSMAGREYFRIQWLTSCLFLLKEFIHWITFPLSGLLEMLGLYSRDMEAIGNRDKKMGVKIVP